MSEPVDNLAQRRLRNQSAIYVLLVAVMVVTAVLSLWIGAPAWWPGAPGLHRPQRFEEMQAATRSLYQRQREQLSRYQWRDRAGGRVVIPIERAMELLVKESASTREAQP